MSFEDLKSLCLQVMNLQLYGILFKQYGGSFDKMGGGVGRTVCFSRSLYVVGVDGEYELLDQQVQGMLSPSGV